MKNIILAIAFCFSPALIYAQESFKGFWTNKQSEYITEIIVINDKVHRVVNRNIIDNYTVEEVIIKKRKKVFVTKIYNNKNNYRVTIKYKLKDNNTLVCKFKGDFNKTLEYKRLIYNNTNNGI